VWYRAIVEYFLIAVGHNPVLDEALGLEPQAVHIRPDPALAVPTELVLGPVGAPLELIEKQMIENLVVHHWRLSVMKVPLPSRAWRLST
jgi:hypothetical protein